MAAAVELSVDLVANVLRFKGGTDEASKALKAFVDAANERNKEVNEGFNKLGESCKKIGEYIKKAGELLLVFWGFEKGKQLYESLEGTAAAVVKISQAAGRLGVGVEQLSALKFAADTSGIEFERLTTIMAAGERSIAEFVHRGTGPAAQALRELNVPLIDSSGHVRNMVELMPDLARGLAAVGDNAQQVNLAERIFGRGGGAEFVQLMRETGGAMQDLAEKEAKARAFGVVFDDNTVAIAKRYKESIELISAAWLGLKVKVLDKVGPLLTDIHEDIAKFLATAPQLVGNFVENLRKAWGGDKNAGALFSEFFRSVKDFAVVAIKDLQDVLAPYVALGVDYLASVIGKRLPVALAGAMVDSFAEVQKLVPEALAQFFPEGSSMRGLTDRWAKSFDIGAAGFKVWASSVASSIGTPFGRVGMTPDLLEEMDRATKAYALDMKLLGADVGKSADALFGFGEAWSKFAEKQKEATEGGKPPFGDQDWLNFKSGFSAAFNDLKVKADDFQAFGRSMAGTVQAFSDGVADAFTQTLFHAQNFWQGLKQTFANVSELIVSTALKFIMLRAVTAGLEPLGGLFGPSSAAAPVGPGAGLGDAAGAQGLATFAARGLAFEAGHIMPFRAGGVVSRPTLFPMASGAGLMGEAGPEAVMPLTRVNGYLGVRSSGGGGDVTVQVIDQRSSGAKPTVTQGTGPDGRKMIQVLIRDEVSRAIGSGDLDRALSANYGLSRTGLKR